MNPIDPVVKERRRARLAKIRTRQLRASGRTKAQVMRFAQVSERMVYLWYRGERTSAKVQAAHDALTLPALVGRD